MDPCESPTPWGQPQNQNFFIRYQELFVAFTVVDSYADGGEHNQSSNSKLTILWPPFSGPQTHITRKVRSFKNVLDRTAEIDVDYSCTHISVSSVRNGEHFCCKASTELRGESTRATAVHGESGLAGRLPERFLLFSFEWMTEKLTAVIQSFSWKEQSELVTSRKVTDSVYFQC